MSVHPTVFPHIPLGTWRNRAPQRTKLSNYTTLRAVVRRLIQEITIDLCLPFPYRIESHLACLL